MVVAVSADQPGEALPRVATAQVALDFPEHEARKGSVCALGNHLELGESVAHEPCSKSPGVLQRSTVTGMARDHAATGPRASNGQDNAEGSMKPALSSIAHGGEGGRGGAASMDSGDDIRHLDSRPTTTPAERSAEPRGGTLRPADTPYEMDLHRRPPRCGRFRLQQPRPHPPRKFYTHPERPTIGTRPR